MLDELLGVCVVYLGGLNYFFPVDEVSPVVSKVGTVDGNLHVTIAPCIRASSDDVLQDNFDRDGFVRFAGKDVDSAEEQVYDHLDHALQYRVRLGALTDLPRRAHKFTHMYARYAFYKAGTVQTERTTAQCSAASDVRFDHEHRFVVDVTDAFIKYIASASLAIEVFGCYQSD